MRNLTREQKKAILTMLVNDDELYAGGISRHEQKLLDDYGFTAKQAADVQIKIIRIMRYIGGVK